MPTLARPGLRQGRHGRLTLLALVTDLYGGDHPVQQSGLVLSLPAVELRSAPVRWLRPDARFDQHRAVATREALGLLPATYLMADPIRSVRGAVTLDLPARLDLRGEVGVDLQSGWSESLFFDGALMRGATLLEGDLLWLGFSAYAGSLLREVGGSAGLSLPLWGFALHQGLVRALGRHRGARRGPVAATRCSTGGRSHRGPTLVSER